MKEALEVITQILLIVVLVLQMAFLVYFAYTTYKRFQDDKKCWKQRDQVVNDIENLAKDINNEYKRFVDYKIEQQCSCDKLTDDSKECAEDERTTEDTREDTDKK